MASSAFLFKDPLSPGDAVRRPARTIPDFGSLLMYEMYSSRQGSYLFYYLAIS